MMSNLFPFVSFSERTTKSHEKRPGFQDVAGFVPVSLLFIFLGHF
jgi:hypothetical protein